MARISNSSVSSSSVSIPDSRIVYVIHRPSVKDFFLDLQEYCIQIVAIDEIINILVDFYASVRKQRENDTVIVAAFGVVLQGLQL